MNSDVLRLMLPEKAAGGCAARRTDSDMQLILPIVILLIAEKADFLLIFSLLYILL